MTCFIWLTVVPSPGKNCPEVLFYGIDEIPDVEDFPPFYEDIGCSCDEYLDF